MLLDEYEGDIEQIYRLAREDYISVSGSEKLAGAMSEKSLDRARQTLKWCQENGVGILTPEDELYPAGLRRIVTRPVALYYLGEPIDLEKRMTLAMVGTRKMTEYGRQSAYSIALESARCGAVIVSGMAAGIDGVSHRGAMDGGGYTIAVLGCGIDRPYPTFHEALMKEIAAKGLVVTEYQPFTPPAGYNFPLRNRIISGMSLCTLAVEGDIKSGAMITAGTALYQGRDLCALPGKVGESSSEGTNRLIKNGARIVTCALDVLDPYRYVCDGLDLTRLSYSRPLVSGLKRVHEPPRSDPAIVNSAAVSAPRRPEKPAARTDDTPRPALVIHSQEKPPQPAAMPQVVPAAPPRPDISMLSDEEKKLYDAIGSDVRSADSLYSEYGGSRVLTMLSLMEIKGFVKSLPGGMYRRV